MMPIQARVRHVDQETGQTVEGLFPTSPGYNINILTLPSLPDWDFVFADDERESNPTSFKFMQMAHAWKQAQAKNAAAGGSSGVLSGFAAAKTARESDEDEDEDSEEEKSDLASSQDEDE